jgi:hypothetical protein|tara:strand:- start:2844 stop:4004 length:1161 start_codon:yes stop_codon:yes gene_type:complete
LDVRILNELFSNTGEGWFETHLGCTASDIVKRLRKSRRYNKQQKHEIDDIINDIRVIKALEFEKTLDMYDWIGNYTDVVRSFSPSEKDMKALRKFGDVRQVNLIRACNQWKKSDEIISMLEKHEGVWGDDEKDSWVKAMEERADARLMWKNTLHQMERLTDKEATALHKSSELLQKMGPMTARSIFENLHEKNILHKTMTPMKLSKLLSMYGEEVDIMSGATRSTFVKMDSTGLILKDPFAYASGFLDADGYITITGRGEPRAGFIATGTRGRAHCEHLRKTLGCGVLQLDQKIYKDGQRSQHRLQFYSKNDIKKLLTALMPHLEMKKTQAKAVLAYIDESDSMRKEELKKLVKYSNWSDDTTKAESLLAEWGVDVDAVAKWQEGL